MDFATEIVAVAEFFKVSATKRVQYYYYYYSEINYYCLYFYL